MFLAWLLVPDFIQATNRSRQKQTMDDIRSIATAWEARATFTNSYSVRANHSDRAGARMGGGRLSVAELANALEPTYIRHFPGKDAWGTEFQFAVADYDAAGLAQTYVINSLGSDGRRDRITNLSGATTSFNDDISYPNGSFTRSP